MKESLSCSACSKTWKRPKTRGRKPTICPKCASGKIPAPVAKKAPARKTTKQPTPKKATPPPPEPQPLPRPAPEEERSLIAKVYSTLFPKPSNTHQIHEATANGSTWQCPACKAIVQLNVGIVQPPVHKCTPASLSYKEFVQID